MNDLTEGKEGKLIVKFAIPMLLGNIFQQLYQIIDSVIVGHYLGKQALAAVGSSFPIMFAVIAFVIGIAMAGTVMVSQYFGAKNYDGVRRTIDTLNIFLFFAAIGITIGGIIFSESIFKLIQLPNELLPMATDFFNVYIGGSVFTFGFNAITAILRGLGDSKTPLKFLLISTFLNIVLDILFIAVFGWGIKAVAFATVFSQAVAFLWALWHLNRTHELLQIHLKKMNFDWQIFIKSLKIGMPTGLQQTFVALGMMALMALVNTFGTDVIAAYSVAYRIDMFASMPGMNLSIALSAFVGQNLGANKTNRVYQGLKSSLMVSAFISFILSFIVYFGGNFIMHAFTNDPKVIQIGHEYLKIVGFFYIAFNSMFIIGAVMRGAGDTFIPMLLSLLSLWLVRVPVAYFLSAHIGYIGIWWAIPIAWVLGTIFSFLYFNTGRWKSKVITNITT